MTYCLAISLDAGVVLTSDSRTNAGIDQVSTYSKMFDFKTDADRALVLLSAGNLATTQFVVEQIKRDIRENQPRNLNTLSYMSDTADYVGEILSSRIRRYSENEASGFAPEATLLLAGQIQGNPPQTFMIYPQGNHITTSRETPYLQIGESKYGKPVLDRFIQPDTSLLDAATCSLISMDSTMQSNVSVGPPIEVLIYKRDAFDLSQRYRFHAEHPYLLALRKAWGDKLRKAFTEMPRFSEQ